jgi:hypothetical protein
VCDANVERVDARRLANPALRVVPSRVMHCELKSVAWRTSFEAGVAEATRRQRLVFLESLGQGMGFADDW